MASNIVKVRERAIAFTHLIRRGEENAQTASKKKIIKTENFIIV
jgi:hypothetical protein